MRRQKKFTIMVDDRMLQRWPLTGLRKVADTREHRDTLSCA
jgi:hypothetical protein